MKRVTQKTEKATGYLIGNKIAHKTTKISKSLQQSNSETITNKHHKEIAKGRYLFLKRKT